MVSNTLGSRFSQRTAFGKYQVLARLGRGGMGVVYLAVHVGPAGVHKLLVVKQLREDLAAQDEARSMFLDEARLATRLGHPNIVQTIEVVDEQGDLYLVMEFLDGQPLARLLEPKYSGVLPLPTKLRILVDALEGLHYAHELTDYDGTPLNVVHRDVSPHNIILTYDGHVKLVDFGIAKAADATTVTESGVFKGKLRYASPEQVLCAPVDRRADVFGMGTILWEILAGRRMWQNQGDASVLASLAMGKLPRIREVSSDVPRELEEICAKALETNPDARYATALEFQNALVRYLRKVNDDRNLGATLSSVFAEDRRKLHALIDQQAKAIREASTTRLAMREIPVIAPESSGPLPALPEDKSVARGGLSVESAPPSSRVAALLSARWTWFAAAAFALALAAGGLMALRTSSHEPASAAASATPAPAAEGVVHLSLRAVPASARFVLDGTTLASNPYEADVARDGSAHRLSVAADGFETREIETHFTRDVNVDVTLGPLTPPPSAASSSVAGGPPPASHQGSAHGPTTPRHPSPRSIDEEDPYKR